MTFAAAVLLGACVAAEVAALGLAVLVVVRRGSSFRTSNEAAKQEPDEHKNRRGLFQSFASPRLRSLSGKLRNFASSPWFRALASPLVHLLAFAVLADVLGAVCSLVANMGPRPRAGWHRVAYHLADALVMAWPLAVCWAARAVFGTGGGLKKAGPSPQNPEGAILVQRASALPAVVPASFTVGTLGLVLAHPVPRVWTQRTLHAHELLCVAVTWWAVWRGRSLSWRIEHRALVVLASFETVVATVGPFAGDAFQRWPVVGCGLYLLAFSAVAGVLGRDLRRRA